MHIHNCHLICNQNVKLIISTENVQFALNSNAKNKFSNFFPIHVNEHAAICGVINNFKVCLLQMLRLFLTACEARYYFRSLAQSNM